MKREKVLQRELGTEVDKALERKVEKQLVR